MPPGTAANENECILKALRLSRQTHMVRQRVHYLAQNSH